MDCEIPICSSQASSLWVLPAFLWLTTRQLAARIRIASLPGPPARSDQPHHRPQACGLPGALVL